MPHRLFPFIFYFMHSINSVYLSISISQFLSPLPWTLHCIPERRNPASPTRTLTQASLTRKPWQANRPTPPTGRNLHNKEEPQTASIQKGHPKQNNLNMMKRQRNIQQVKEHNKCPPNQTKEKIRSVPEKEFRVMIIKMIQNLENKMELQINSLETRIEKMQV